jgi:hypothetical protein
MTTPRILSTIDTNPKKKKKGSARTAGDFSTVCNTIGIFDDQVRTSGGIPLITGIKRIYKNSAIVSRPDSADAPTSNL